VDLKVEYNGHERTLVEGTTATIGADPTSTVQIARPGISRRHAIVRHDGSHWVIQDASSRNGTFHSGARIQVLDIDGTTTVQLGHPTEGATIVLTPEGDDVRVETRVVEPAPQPIATEVPPFEPVAAPAVARPELDLDPRLDGLIDALNDTVSSVKGLTWSVWAMIAVTAALVVLTLFVAIVGN
jgi:pSer/pThr/pTyr-binding forkhead associated (FHA) protein